VAILGTKHGWASLEHIKFYIELARLLHSLMHWMWVTLIYKPHMLPGI